MKQKNQPVYVSDFYRVDSPGVQGTDWSFLPWAKRKNEKMRSEKNKQKKPAFAILELDNKYKDEMEQEKTSQKANQLKLRPHTSNLAIKP